MLVACHSPKREAGPAPEGPFVRYSVSGNAVAVAQAVTPFDAQPREREAFLGWFKRGFETGYTGGAPLMIEWDETPVARAGRRGYEFGLDEGKRFRNESKDPGRAEHTAQIPPDP